MLERGAMAARLSEDMFAKKRNVGDKEFYMAWRRPMGVLPAEDDV